MDTPETQERLRTEWRIDHGVLDAWPYPGPGQVNQAVRGLDNCGVSFAREIEVKIPRHFTEGGYMHHANGRYYLSYSHGSWRHASYSVHHATGTFQEWTSLARVVYRFRAGPE
ncbi:MAG: hypothetical protein KJ072_22705 [Verrucomicrobia bacterium]|nr:hypothetical protein [Verrucomicrobiota bacterium]